MSLALDIGQGVEVEHDRAERTNVGADRCGGVPPKPTGAPSLLLCHRHGNKGGPNHLHPASPIRGIGQAKLWDPDNRHL